mmetsp:Transcript_25260/g.37796  ORF Transcript_25260/g.37796 Transcript_25260/m.37796 type:complete len:441 (-) Transcript_25260:221-1543(-)|eukprot:CAMPEP_0203675024 /NCGR_PEP_ID=MMETSP0090-20130426/18418_1 /ASSEMBLY_ACC=CAM_ASM_001088 /TAXON_ID=426623 /ORGANISM="Chaetoceros affinis, Strain CCMP159" /LENGTH=440 /DNA_ID=CAMNT_0050541071 /DNA_START=102 /DNA_END=1424 /DNA_ORIENTATION=-
MDEVDHEAISKRQSLKIRSNSVIDELEDTSTSCTIAEMNILLRTSPFYKFVLTGGPCGGKTTALARLSYYLRERGFEVFTVPEAFTILASNGFSMDYFSIQGMPTCVQHTVMDMQMSLEDSFERVLRARGRPAVLLCDRGLMDGSAYMSSDDWDDFLNQRGINSADIREGRYNAVFHLVTAAEGAERFYTLENNAARHETPDEARKVDHLSRAAWVGHPKHFVIDNTTDFEGKMNKLVSIASRLVGLPTTSKSLTLKYLLKEQPNFELFPEDVKYSLFEVEKVYLYDVAQENGTNQNYKEEYSFIRKRTQISARTLKKLGTSYGLTTVHITYDGKQVEMKRIITAREYNSAYKTRDETRHIVRQTRIAFIWKMQNFNIHVFKEPVKDLCICHVQSANDSGGTEDETASVEFPPFLNVERHLENNENDSKEYGTFNISLIK